MRVLPSLNGVNYSHIHQDSSIRRIASYMKTLEEVPPKPTSPSYPETDTLHSLSKPDISDLKRTAGECTVDNKNGKDVTPSTDGHNDLSNEKIIKSVHLNEKGEKGFQKDIRIEIPKLTGNTPDANFQNPVKLGSIRIESLPHNTECKNLIKIGKITINKI
jgi:hypothetical protein